MKNVVLFVLINCLSVTIYRNFNESLAFVGNVTPDTGDIIKAKENLKVAYLNQEFDINPSNTIKEEFLTVYRIQTEVIIISKSIRLIFSIIQYLKINFNLNVNLN